MPPEAPGELVAKWSAFGWRVLEVDGNRMSAVVDALDRAREGDGRPTVVISNTVKGKGVSYMEGHYYWHTRTLTADEFATALADLGEPAAETTGGPR